MDSRRPEEIWNLLDPDVRRKADERVVANEHVVFFLAQHAGISMSIPEMQSIEAFRYAELVDRIQWKPERPRLDLMEAALDEIVPAPRVIEGEWDGDSCGWFVTLRAVCSTGGEPSGDRIVVLGTYQGRGGDSRLFTGEVSPWPEEGWATEDGRHLANRAGIPFRFVAGDGPTR